MLANVAVMLALLVVNARADTGCAKSREDRVARIERAIMVLKAPGDRAMRIDTAEALAETVEQCPAAASGAATVRALASLLEDEEDAIRYWIAAALGYVGPKAASAIPALERALDQRKDREGSLTSVEAIRVALERIRGQKKAPTPRKSRR